MLAAVHVSPVTSDGHRVGDRDPGRGGRALIADDDGVDQRLAGDDIADRCCGVMLEPPALSLLVIVRSGVPIVSVSVAVTGGAVRRSDGRRIRQRARGSWS